MKNSKLFLASFLMMCCVGFVNAQGEKYRTDLFGPNMYIFGPEDDMQAIAKFINDVHDQKMKNGHWSSERYAFYFKPGDYTASAEFNIGFYTSISGLGKTPLDTKIKNLLTPAFLGNDNATQTFWRSAENLAVMDVTSSNKELKWGVSQAAPIRRVYSERDAWFDWHGGWASGGFAADCYFEGAAGSHSQQQWYTRNSYSHLGSNNGINNGHQKFNTGVWNTCYQGVEFGPGVDMSKHTDGWSRGLAVSNVELTPIIREKPFLFMDSDGRYKVFKPALKKDSKGVSWSENNIGEGTTYDLLNDFYVVKPGTSAATMNAQLNAGKHLFITPGLYELSEPIHVKNANTIILGTGFATLAPAQGNKESAIVIDDVHGVTVASLFFDALYDSRTLMQVGPQNADKNLSSNPTLIADVFFRVGGTKGGRTNVDIALEINSSDVIGDHTWLWRADHGSGVGWNTNTSKNGMVVNGHYVTFYGLFNEHFQQYQNIWNGEHGRVYFFQCETPYDIPNLGAYTNPVTGNGWASYKVADHVQWHEASMLGIYVVINTGSINIQSSIEVPERSGVKIHHACNVRINGQGFRWIVNETGQSTLQNGAQRLYVVDFPGNKDVPKSEPFIRPGDPSSIKQTPLANDISAFLNPVTDYLQIKAEDNVTVTVFDMGGRTTYKQAGIEPIYMGAYAKGVYFVTVVDTNGIYKTVKVLKQ